MVGDMVSVRFLDAASIQLVAEATALDFRGENGRAQRRQGIGEDLGIPPIS